MDQIRLKAYGKVNLGLDVIRKRADGYHEVRMIMQTVKLFDRLYLKKTKERKIDLTTNLSYVPSNEQNLVYKAIALLQQEFDLQEGVKVELEKHIPVAAGMAGGSTDCAAALYGMNRLFSLGLTTKQLMEYGVKLGADVPYCIMRGTALSEGIGEVLTRLSPMPNCYFLIAKPSISVSTKFVYENLKLQELMEHPDIDGMIEALDQGNLKGITDRMSNVLETVTIPNYPIIDKIKKEMIKLGAMNALMSGSGPTVFGIFDNLSQAKAALFAMRKTKLAKQVFLAELFNSNGTE